MVRWLAAAHNSIIGGQPLKSNIITKEKYPNSVELNFSGVRMTLSFAVKEDPTVKESVVEILTDAYEKKRLGENSGEKLGKF